MPIVCSEHRIAMGGASLAFTLRRDPRARRLRITMHEDGKCVVTVPRRCGLPAAEKFLRSSEAWVARVLAKRKEQPKLLSSYHSDAEYRRMKARTRAFVLREIEEINRVYGFRFAGIAIRNQRSRWGSCSERGRLNFHYKLILLPRRLARYVIVHELCHLQELNHSPRFWALVARYLPEYAELRRELKKW